MKKMNILKSLVDCGVVAVVRGKTKEVGVDIAKACVKGNVKGLEITFTNKYAADIIKELANIYECREDIVIGAGTVLDAETARIAILAGAKYIVSPSFNKETAILCNRYKVPYIPGVMTINEIVSSHEVGVDIVKIFPGSVYGPSYIKAIKGPLPYANMMVTGGVNINNIGEWFKSGVDLVVICGELNTLGEAGKFKEITEVCNDYIEKLNAVREG
mgnify:FL=1